MRIEWCEQIREAVNRGVELSEAIDAALKPYRLRDVPRRAWDCRERRYMEDGYVHRVRYRETA